MGMNDACGNGSSECPPSLEAGHDFLNEIRQVLDREEGLSQEGKEQILDFVRARLMAEP